MLEVKPKIIEVAKKKVLQKQRRKSSGKNKRLLQQLIIHK